jgi:LysM repeat protein
VAAAPVRESAPTLKLYTVRAGDTLYAIALRYRTTVDALLGVNNLAAKAVLQPGLKLRLP